MTGKASLPRRRRIRFTPDNGHVAIAAACPLRTKNGSRGSWTS